MKIDYPQIKKYFQIVVFSFNLLIFLIVLFCTNSNNKNYKEYTDVSKFFLCLYILLIYGFLIMITIYPGMLYFLLKKHFLFVFTDKGKLIISYLICLIFWFARNKPQLSFAILSTISTTFLLIYEFIFYFQKVENFLNNKGIEFINRKKTTIDINNLDKNLENKMNQSNAPNNNINITNNIGSSIVDKSTNQQNQQIVDVVSGYE
jgi:hypothetical protein